MHQLNILRPQHLAEEDEVVSPAPRNQRGLRKTPSPLSCVPAMCFVHQIFSLSSEAAPVMLRCLPYKQNPSDLIALFLSTKQNMYKP